jgi:peptidoglycan/LPS O-acetylase OafA/YrhL
MLNNWQVFSVLKAEGRNSSVDIFRGLAIIVVVLFHYNHILPFGYLGVDLFFVISGLLVGGLLTKEFDKSGKVNFPRFFLQRGFKIWPSYYFFLVFGSLLAYFFYQESRPDQLIHWGDSLRYIFFYQNYTGDPLHWSFDHVWSLCVEEHFYIMLPVLFLFVQMFVGLKYRRRAIYFLIICTIVAGVSLKAVSWFFTTGKDTYSATHNRIDALAWGVLLNLILVDYGHLLKHWLKLKLFFFLGVILFGVALYFHVTMDSVIYQKIIFHSIVPFTFFLMILGLYYADFSKWYPVRFVAYYSYNWYLWHPPFAFIVTDYFGVSVVGVTCFLIITFFMAIISTTLIEEFFLRKRTEILGRLFPVN